MRLELQPPPRSPLGGERDVRLLRPCACFFIVGCSGTNRNLKPLFTPAIHGLDDCPEVLPPACQVIPDLDGVLPPTPAQILPPLNLQPQFSVPPLPVALRKVPLRFAYRLRPVGLVSAIRRHQLPPMH